MGKAKRPTRKSGRFAVRFRPIPLSCNFPRAGGKDEAAERARAMLRGRQRFWGIPFALAPRGDAPNVVRLEAGDEVLVKVGARATHLCFLHYWEGKPTESEGYAGGRTVCEYRLCYADGETLAAPIRTRFEIGWEAGTSYSAVFYASVSHEQTRTLDFMSEQARRAFPWGTIQPDSAAQSLAQPTVFPLANPRPREKIESVLLRGVDEAAVGVLGLTLYEGPGHPLRHNARRYFKLSLPQGTQVESLDVDIGVLVRDAGAASPRDDEWVGSPQAGLGTPADAPREERTRLLEVSAADGAMLRVKARTEEARRTYTLSVGEASAGASTDRDVRLEVVHPGRTWVHVTVRDEETGRPVSARIHLSGPNGEYYAPYGHHTVINDNWFEDYGADIKLGQMNYAYVPGTFQTALPVGEVFVEVAKGFEYEPLRRKIEILPGQRELELRIRRWSDWRARGWVTADTHVHFLSPHTAWLQGQCEGLNLINLLASQWGRLFTNVGDITGEMGVEKDDTMVWVGTENRNHMLGHISMLGTQGEPVYPMCCGGPSEAYFGDPDERTLAEWADECRRKQGVVIRPHFPGPNLENPVDIVLGKFDGLEICYMRPLDPHNLKEYYRYLNCGYRVACVGGTDKMSASMPVGGVRTYARLDPDRPFNFENWGRAVRAGRTFSTSGPLIDLKVEGVGMGGEVRLTGGNGTVEVHAEATCAWPLHRLEIVMNGRVVATTTEPDGARFLRVSQKVPVQGSCWFAARCDSNLISQTYWGMNVAAHTSPVYVVVPGTELFSPSDATYMLTLIDGGLTYLDTLSVRYDEKRHQEMKAIYEHAKAHLKGRLHRHDPAER